MGRFELEPFAPGTHVLAEELVAAGGGETVAARPSTVHPVPRIVTPRGVGRSPEGTSPTLR